MGRQSIQRTTVALAGNPNVGKSTLFNALTGMHRHTGNWPGKTVSLASGTVRHGDTLYTLVDLPGTYSLDGKSEEERVAAEFLRDAAVDCTVVVCDGSCLERSLILALQILQRCDKAVVCVNLMDEACRHGIEVNGKLLAKYLQVPVIFTAAGQKKGINTLLTEVEKVIREPLPSRQYAWTDCIAAAQEITARCVHRKSNDSANFRRSVDKLLVSRRFGLPLMGLVFLGIICLTVWGANAPGALLEAAADWLYARIERWLLFAPWWVRGVLLDGLYATSARVICVMLPPMAIFFPLFTLLEDVGYLPRMAFMLDPCMACCGGCGKQALTLCMGLGCNAVGVMGCRIIDSPRERLTAILTNAMVPCNGRFPTLILLGSIFFPEAGAALVVAACVALGMAGAVAVSGLLNKTVLRSEDSSFLMEMPPFRRPRLGKIFIQSLRDRTLYICGRALTVAAPVGILLWILANTGLMNRAAELIDPLGRLLGMNGVLLLAFLLAVPANELVIPVVLMAITGAGSLQETAAFSTQALLGEAMTWQMAVCTMVFTLFHWPCATTVTTIYRETRSIPKTLAGIGLPTAVGMLFCTVLNLVLHEFAV